MQCSSRGIVALIILLVNFCFKAYSQDKSSTLFTLLNADETGVIFSNDLVDSGEINILMKRVFTAVEVLLLAI